MSSIRISKVLSELNIGLDTAVDFLLSKGHEVEKNRNTKISDEQYALLLGNFASERILFSIRVCGHFWKWKIRF